MAQDTDYILTLLKENGMVSSEDVRAAKQAALESEDGGEAVSPVDFLIKNNVISEVDLLTMLAQQYGVELMDLDGYEVPLEVRSTLSTDVVRHYNVVPVMLHDDVLIVAMSDPTDMETLDTIRYIYGGEVEEVVATKKQIAKLIDRYFVEEEEVATKKAMKQEDELELLDDQADVSAAEGDDQAPIIRLVTKLILDAYKMRASDIHLEPMEKRYRVRYRIDGALREIPGPPKYLQANFTSRVKIMAHLDITEKRIPQDGRIQISVGDKDIDLRVSSIPTIFGESIVMRILDKSSIQLDIPKLGFYADDLDLVNKIINYPDGIFLVTGPTGSGKTTSLYAFLNTINTP
ncbi:MAG: Flp pilus assembly complex ATPase component TadA, partial [Victivallaceae bacterium]|nr:Flp pilus assembly complex ATPase component TadA [Victivallaceae bacterium]